MDEFREVENVGLGGNVKNALGGVLVGLLMFFSAFPLLWWNEGRAVHTAQMLEEAKSGVVSIQASENPDDYEGQLVHLQGDIEVDEELEDAQFGVKAKRPGLSRQVEMFQWVENKTTKEEKKTGGGTQKITTYSYKQEWRDSPVNSGSFKKKEGHANPSMPFEQFSIKAQSGKLGNFAVDTVLMGEISASDRVTLDEAVVTRLQAKVGDRKVALQGDSDELYVGDPSVGAKVGDLKIRFLQLRRDVSVVAVAKSGLLRAKTMSNGESLLIVAMGKKTAKEMIEWEETKNTMVTWLVRFGGFLLMFFGLKSMMSIVVALANIIPFIGGIVGFGTSLIAMLIAAPCTLVTIALAWIAYRPVIGITLLVVGFGITFLVLRKGKNTVTLPDGTQAELPG